MLYPEGGIPVSGSPDEKYTEESSQNPTTKSECNPGSGSAGSNLHESQHHSSAETPCSAEKFLDSFVLLCCEDSLRLYSVKSIIQVLLCHFYLFLSFIIVLLQLLTEGSYYDREIINLFVK